MQAIKEQFLLHRIRRVQDQNAFAELIKPYASGINRLLRSKLPKPEDAEDAYSTTLLRAWNYLLSTPEVPNPAGLLHTVARSVIADFYQRKKLETIPIVSESGEEMRLEDVRAFGQITASAELAFVRAAMDRLKEEHREVIVLRFMEGLKAREIGERMQISEGAVRNLLQRAVEALKKEFN